MFLFLKQNPLDKLSSFFAASFRIFYLTEIKSNLRFNRTNASKPILKQVNLYGPVSSCVLHRNSGTSENGYCNSSVSPVSCVKCPVSPLSAFIYESI